MMDKEEHNHSPLSRIRLNKVTLNVIFIPALILLFLVSVYLYHQVNSLITANHWVVHTEEVIQKTDAVLYEMVDIESHQRGFLISGNDQYLTELDDAKNRLQREIDSLELLTKDNSEQKKRVAVFSDLIEQRISMLGKVAKLKMENKFDADGFTQFTRSQELSSRVKGLGQEIKSVESVLLSERNQNALSRASYTNAILIIGSGFGILSLLVAFILTNSELSQRQTMESKNKKSQMRLRGIIESATDMIAAFDKDNNFIIFNQPYQREFKKLFNKSIKVGMSLEQALHDIGPERHELALQWQNSLTQNESSQNLELMEQEQQVVYELNVSHIHNDENEMDGSVQIIRNISRRIHEHFELQRSYESLATGMKKLQDKNEQITLLVEMSDIMLACSSQDELSHVMTKYSGRMLQFSKGFLYMMHPSKNYLEIIASWGDATPQTVTFSPDQCWAIRRGRTHQVNINHEELICDHVTPAEEPEILLCVPLMAQNDIYGMLYLEVQPEEIVRMEDHKLLINAFAELTALALANVRLRENLRYQSIRDPLTGLYNRRYLEDFMIKQLHQAERSGTPLSVLMMDLDHFKKLNDTYGHDAGDAALKEFGKILQNDIRMSDVASRYGGEEFIVVLYDADANAAKKRAENIRDAISMVHIKYGAQLVGPITVSIGIAEYPKDGRTLEALIENADQALYYAKNHGRNQVVMCSQSQAVDKKTKNTSINTIEKT
ncbi:MAG: diguanylate cyclase [Legionella sp.]